MKTHIIRMLARDAVENILRNPRRAAAGIMLSAIAFFALCLSGIIYFNVEFNIRRVDAMPEIEAFLYPDAATEQVTALHDALRLIPGTGEIVHITKEDAYERALKILGDNSELLEALGMGFLPESFTVDVLPDYDAENVAAEITSYAEVESVSFARDEALAIRKISAWSHGAVLAVFILSAQVAFIVISALIGLSVMPRRREIEIKQFLGADDSFILLPFVIESVIISLMGALISWSAAAILYGKLAGTYGEAFTGLTLNLFGIAPMESFIYIILLAVFFAAVIFGIIAGTVSVRRHLKSGGNRIAPI